MKRKRDPRKRAVYANGVERPRAPTSRVTVAEINEANRAFYADPVNLLAVSLYTVSCTVSDMQPAIARDEKRQAGTRKERRPRVTEWISRQIDRNPGAKSPDLWGIAPDWLTEQIGFGSFQKRVTAARKCAASK